MSRLRIQPTAGRYGRYGRALFLLLFVAILAVRAGAAAERAGQVTFAGLPLPGATVTATQGDRKVTTVSDQQGIYRFADLSDGSWSIKIEMAGFSPVVQEVAFAADTAPSVTEMKLLSFGEIAARPAPPPAPAVTDTRPGNSPAARPNATAPAPPSRPAGNSAAPAPSAGAAGTPAPNAAAAPPPSAAAPADSEAAMAADGLLINGSVNNGGASPFAQSAAFGNNRTGGRSLYNGSIGGIFGNSVFDARPFSFTGRPAQKPDYNDYQFLSTFGGPLKIPGMRTRPQFFGGYQRTSDTRATTQSAIMPSFLERRGDFSQTVDPSGQPVTIRDPLTGQPFEGNVIPTERLSPQALALLGYYPGANVVPGQGDGRYNFQRPTEVITQQDSVQARVTQALSTRNSLASSFTYQRTGLTSTGLFGFTDESYTSAADVMVNFQRRVSLFTSFRVRYQFTRLASAFTPYFSNRANVSGDAGINGNDQTPENWGPPALVFSSVNSLSTGLYQDNRTFTNAWNGEVYWSHGRHYVTYGGDLKKLHYNVFSQLDPRGSFNFSGALTGHDFADFLLGVPNSSSIGYGNPDKFLRAWASDAYVSDDWRVNPALTVTAGLRWEYETPYTEKYGRLSNLDVAEGFGAVETVTAENPTGAITGNRYPESLLEPDRFGVQPRLGVAWRPVPGSSLIVRGGYGVYRNAAIYQPLALLLSQQAPFSQTSSIQNSLEHPLTLANGFVTATGLATNTFAVDPDLRAGFAQNWQVSLQRDLPASLTVITTYLGTHGSRLMQEFLPNTYPVGAPNPCPTCPAGFIYLTSSGSSSRHAGQFQLRRRLRNGLTAQVQYTLAQANDDATAFSGASMSGASIAQDWQNLDAEWGPSTFDQRHLVTASVQYTTGIGARGGALLDGLTGALVKGWTFTGNLTTGSGMPFSPLYLRSVPGTGVTGPLRGSTTGVPDEAPDGYYVNPESYAAPAAGQWGNAGRNSLRGPSQFLLNAGVTRTFNLGGRWNLDWRIDATNVLNHVTFSGFNTNIGSPQFGLPNRDNGMRKLQSTLRLRF